MIKEEGELKRKMEENGGWGEVETGVKEDRGEVNNKFKK